MSLSNLTSPPTLVGYEPGLNRKGSTMYTMLLGALLASAPLLAAPKDVRGRLFSENKTGLRTPILFDVMNEKDSLAKRETAPPVSSIGALKPDRVYLYWFPPEKRWFYLLTDGNGDYRNEPMEFLRMTSTIPGAKLCAKDANQRYMLGEDGHWKITFQKEFYAFWIYSTPPRIKFVEFGTL